jgi:hypothetical protein
MSGRQHQRRSAPASGSSSTPCIVNWILNTVSKSVLDIVHKPHLTAYTPCGPPSKGCSPIFKPSQVLNPLWGLSPCYRHLEPVITAKFQPHTFMSTRSFLTLEDPSEKHDAKSKAGQALMARHGSGNSNVAGHGSDNSTTFGDTTMVLDEGRRAIGRGDTWRRGAQDIQSRSAGCSTPSPTSSYARTCWRCRVDALPTAWMPPG